VGRFPFSILFQLGVRTSKNAANPAFLDSPKELFLECQVFKIAGEQFQ
jgi:hypothetical protein